jgi:hypothetical protein
LKTLVTEHIQLLTGNSLQRMRVFDWPTFTHQFQND